MLSFLNAYQSMSEGNQVIVMGMHSMSWYAAVYPHPTTPRTACHSPLLYASPSVMPLTAATPVHVTTKGLVSSLRLLAAQPTGTSL